MKRHISVALVNDSHRCTPFDDHVCKLWLVEHSILLNPNSKGPLALHGSVSSYLLSQGAFLSCVLSLGDTNKKKAWVSG